MIKNFDLHCIQWRIQGRGQGPPLFIDQDEAQRAKKNLFETRPPLISGSGWPPPVLSEGLDLPLVYHPQRVFWFHRLRSFYLKLNKYLTVYTTSVQHFSEDHLAGGYPPSTGQCNIIISFPNIYPLDSDSSYWGQGPIFFSKVPITFQARKAVSCLPCLHWRSELNRANLTSLWDNRNHATILLVLILKFAFWTRKVSGTFDKWAPELKCISSSHSWKREATISNYICPLFLQQEVVYKSVARKSGTLLFITDIIMSQQESCLCSECLHSGLHTFKPTERKKPTQFKHNADQIWPSSFRYFLHFCTFLTTWSSNM